MDSVPLASGWGAFFSELFRSADLIGFVLATLFIVLLGMIVDMFSHLRIGRMIPEALLNDVQTEMANGEYEKALELCEKADCLVGQVFAAALSKTDYSFDRMADAMRGEVRIQGLVLRQWVAQFRTTAVAGALLGVAGAVFEAMRLVFDAAQKGGIPSAVVSSFETRGIAYSLLFSLFMGALMAIVSLAVATVANSRLEKILLEAERLGEDLLDPFRPLPQTEEE